MKISYPSDESIRQYALEEIGWKSLRATHPFMLVIICDWYEKKPSRTRGATEWTRDNADGRTDGRTHTHTQRDRPTNRLNQIHPNESNTPQPHPLFERGIIVQTRGTYVISWDTGGKGTAWLSTQQLNPPSVLYNVHINVRVNVSFVIYKKRNKHITYGAHNTSYNREYSNCGDTSCAPLLSWLENSSKRSCKQCVSNNVKKAGLETWQNLQNMNIQFRKTQGLPSVPSYAVIYPKYEVLSKPSLNKKPSTRTAVIISSSNESQWVKIYIIHPCHHVENIAEATLKYRNHFNAFMKYNLHN